MRRGTAEATFSTLTSIPTEGCVLWPGAHHDFGYGEVRLGGVKRRAHVVACERAHGPSPVSGWMASHTCGNARCVNPRHLVWESAADNNARKVAHGTENRGERCAMAKLTTEAVIAIRARCCDLATQAELADEFGVARNTIWSVVHRRSWAWLEEPA